MAQILKVKQVRDQENETKVVCVRFEGKPSFEELKEATKKAPFPWGEALPSLFFEEEGWWDVGNA